MSESAILSVSASSHSSTPLSLIISPADGDGKITVGDWTDLFDKMMSDFGDMDTNNDGQLSREEWAAKYDNDSAFDAYDVNGDGHVSKQEFAMGQLDNNNFNAADADNDGKMSREVHEPQPACCLL